VPAIIAARAGKVMQKDATFEVFAKGLADIRLWGVVVACRSNWHALANSSLVSKCSETVWYNSVRTVAGVVGLGFSTQLFIRVMDAGTNALALDFRQCVLDINEGGDSLPVRILAP